jgi:hypothetical protein
MIRQHLPCATHFPFQRHFQLRHLWRLLLRWPRLQKILEAVAHLLLQNGKWENLLQKFHFRLRTRERHPFRLRHFLLRAK